MAKFETPANEIDFTQQNPDQKLRHEEQYLYKAM